MGSIFVTIIILMIALINNVSSVSILTESSDSSIDRDVLSNGIRIIPRNEWLAQPPEEPPEKLELPVKLVIISHTATEFCYKQSKCALRVRLIQTYHIESNKWSDIAYNFLVGGDGHAYEGRGWDNIGAHTFNYNNRSIGISFIGLFNEILPLQKQLDAAQKLIKEGVKQGKISKDYILLGHRQLSTGTSSPGDALFELIKLWPHWSPTDIVDSTNDFRVITRDEWFAQSPVEPLEKLELPVKYVMISHTGTEFCYNQSECARGVRLIQTYHIESNKWSDIAYNFLVGGDGNAYEGRGWDNIGAHTFNYNDKSIGISFIGLFNEILPLKKQLDAAQKVIEEGVKLGKISKDYILLGHRQVSTGTLSPGDALFELIKLWPHWSPTDIDGGTNDFRVIPRNEWSPTGIDGSANDFRVIPRQEWFAEAPVEPLEKLELPVKYVMISHTATEFCYKTSECAKRVSQIQTFHVESYRWSDIAYSFLVGGDGHAYEGRGWDNIGAHTFSYNNRSIGISFIGLFNDFVPLQKQIHAAQKLIEEGVKLGKISKDYILLGHRQVTSGTRSPGDALFTLIKSWPHWSPKP